MIPKTFNADVEIKAKWKDQRIVFKNLANHGNVFDKFWQDKLWLPPLYFSNTKEDLSILNGDTVSVEVQRQGKPRFENWQLNEGTYYLGDENELVLYSKTECTFRCQFELSNFPFDVQKCSIDVMVPYEIRNYTTLKPEKLIYKGK